ncbi:cytochrome P450 4g1-like [Atheta coriaria]|uniref:cytochrome P450 4g1-like n=1 Tax=Dalotia coriaria TaxID=877792 RepID=UPI0031F44ECD
MTRLCASQSQEQSKAEQSLPVPQKVLNSEYEEPLGEDETEQDFTYDQEDFDGFDSTKERIREFAASPGSTAPNMKQIYKQNETNNENALSGNTSSSSHGPFNKNPQLQPGTNFIEENTYIYLLLTLGAASLLCVIIITSRALLNTTLADIQEMKYLELVIKETLKLYPPAAMYTRKIMENGITYPTGMTIGIFAYGIQRDEDHYENPEKFDPERFSKERNNRKQLFAFIPFSAGPRNCIGQKFAMLELKTLLSKILRNFRVNPATPHHTLNLTPTIVLRSSNGIKISLAETLNIYKTSCI